MPIYVVETPGGAKLRIEAPDEQSAIATGDDWHKQQSAAAGAKTEPAKPAPSMGEQAATVAKDVAKQIPTGIAEGVTGLLGLPGLAQKGGEWLGEKGATWLGEKMGIPPEQLATIGQRARERFPRLFPTPDELQGYLEKGTGVPLPEAETRPGRYTRTISSFLPGALAGPGGLARKAVGYAAVPGAISEGAGEFAKEKGVDERGQTIARVAGALAGIPAGMGVSAALGAGANRFRAGQSGRQIEDVLQTPVDPGAVRRLAASLEADRTTPASARAAVGELDPGTMLLDTGRQMRGRAEAIAAQPGRGQNIVLDAVEGRTGPWGSETSRRIEDVLNREMGPAHNAVQLADQVDGLVDRLARPLYRQVMEAHPTVKVPAEIAQRPAIASAMKDAVELAKNYGEKLSSTETRTILRGPGFHMAEDVVTPATPSLRHWDYVKKVLDQRIQGYYKSGGATELSGAQKADLGGLLDARRSLVNFLDETTQGAYREARQVAAAKPQLREAYDVGRQAFNTKLLPEEFADELAQMSAPERTMAREGFRRELDRLISAHRNEGASSRRLLSTNHVLEKGEHLFGRDAMREISRRVDAEDLFQETTQNVARNSRTAVRQEMIKDTATPSSSELQATTIPGLALAGGRGGLNYLRRHGMEGTREQIANVLTARGPQIGPTVDALAAYNARRSAPVVGDPRMAAILDALLAGQR